MRILFLCHRFPFPPIGGAKVRAFHMIQSLQRRHRVTVGSLVRSREEAEAGVGLADHCEHYFHGRISTFAAALRMVARLPVRTPSSMGYFFSPSLRNWVRGELERGDYDLILVHCSSMAPYVSNVVGLPKLLDFTDMDSQKWLAYAKVKHLPLSLVYLLEGYKLQHAETELARRFDLCTTATALEQATLDSFGTGTETDWFPNGVDFEFFSPADEPYVPFRMVFLGRMDYYPNQVAMHWFCSKVFPIVKQRFDLATLFIVGANPPGTIRRLGRIPDVTVTGSVPDVRPYLRSGALSVAPLSIARGTQNKVLESLASRVPVVCSPLVARGVDVVVGKHLLGAETPTEYADAIGGLLGDPARREILAEAGHARVKERHSWSSSMARLQSIIDRCIRNWRERGRPSAEEAMGA